MKACVLWLLVLALSLVARPMVAQQRQLDSLKTRLALKLPDTIRAQTCYDIANIFYKQNQSDSAVKYLKSMRPICQRINYRLGLGDYNRLTGVIQMHQGLFKDALTSFQNAVTEYSSVNSGKAIAMVYNSLGLLYKTMGQTQGVQAYSRQGLVYMEKAIALNERLNVSKSLRLNYTNIGILYEDLGDNRLARDYFYKALGPIGQTEATLEDARVLYNNLGKNYNVEGEYAKAITYLEKALAINLAQNKITSLIHNYRNMATAYDGLKQPDKAMLYVEKALKLSEAVKEVALVSTVYSTAATVYAHAGRYDKAYGSLVRNKRIDDSLMTVAKTRTISQLQGQYATQQANALATVRANLELAKTEAIARMEAQKARQIAAIQAEERRREAQIKATADIEKTRAIAELQTKYDTQSKVQQIAELGQRNQERSQQIKYMTGGLGMLFILLSALVGQYTVIRRANRRLSVQNVIITANSQQLMNQSDQLRTLMKELHHRVKNNLAIVSSLLKLQLNRLDDEKAIQAVRVGQQRVEAMSLIHQRLYQTDQLTAVNMAEYLSDLADSLMRAYGYQHDEFDLQLNVDLPELDVDVAIPLGLIVNELATNAFKYAYSNNQRPLLRINLFQNKNNACAGMTLEIQDNGPGIEAQDWQGPNKPKSFGKRLILSLSEQLDGQVEWLKQSGTLFRLSFPTDRLASAS